MIVTKSVRLWSRVLFMSDLRKCLEVHNQTWFWLLFDLSFQANIGYLMWVSEYLSIQAELSQASQKLAEGAVGEGQERDYHCWKYGFLILKTLENSVSNIVFQKCKI